MQPKCRLDANEAPFPLPQEIWNEIADLARSLEPHRYLNPDRSGLLDAIARYAGVPTDHVLVGNGSDEILLGVCLGLAKGGSVVAPGPTFYMYRWAADMAGANYVEVPLLPGWDLDVSALLDAGESHPGAVLFLCRPNNPTGKLYPREVTEEVIRHWPGPVLVDEAYFEFSRQTMVDLVGDKVMVSRTFSKAFSLAGLRLGYLLVGPGVRSRLRACLQPYNVSVFTQAAAMVMLRHTELARAVVELCDRERGRLYREMSAIPNVEVYPSCTNFLLFRCPGDAQQLLQAILARGVRVRSFDPPSVASRYLRVSVGAPEANDAFLAALREVSQFAVEAEPAAGQAAGGESAAGEAATAGLAIAVQEVRSTVETEVSVVLRLLPGTLQVATGHALFDHLLRALAFHGGFSVELNARGDMPQEPHHLVEDVGLTLGRALARAFEEMASFARFGEALIPMDDALVQVAVDISGRPHLSFDLPNGATGGLNTGQVREFFAGLARGAGLTLHIRGLAGHDPHHLWEAAAKATGVALHRAAAPSWRAAAVPSTKGTLT